MTATEKVTRISKRIETLKGRRRESESLLAVQTAKQQEFTAKRKKLLAELPGADIATEAWIHNELDDIDSAHHFSSRATEALSNALPILENEIAGLESELREVESQVARDRQAKLLTDFRNRLEQAARQLAEDLDNARRNFGSLHLCAFKGIHEQGAEEHRLAALHICEQVFAEFASKQVNLEARGLELVRTGFQNTSNTVIPIRPMVGG